LETVATDVDAFGEWYAEEEAQGGTPVSGPPIKTSKMPSADNAVSDFIPVPSLAS